MSTLTKTQRFILEAAHFSRSGIIRMGAGDRKGTRISYITMTGVPVIIAYQYPEYFLLARKLLRKGNDPNTYTLTKTGYDLITASLARRRHR